jgi:hypothetical protein
VRQITCICLANTIVLCIFIFFYLEYIYTLMQKTLIIMYNKHKEPWSLLTPKTNTHILLTTWSKYLFKYTSFTWHNTRHLASPSSKQVMIKQNNKIATKWRTQNEIFYNSKIQFKPHTFNQQY